jgi:membrane-associated phospholipid phosphatase
MRMAAGRSPLRRLTLLPPKLNRPAWMAVTVCLLIPVVLGARYAGRSRAGRLDTGIERWLREHVPDQAAALHDLAALGNLGPVLVMMAVVATAGYLIGRWRMALLAVLGPTVAIAATETLKPLIGRKINDYWAFPSGHATAVFSLFAVAVLIWRNRPRSGVAFVGGIGLAVLGVGAIGMGVALVRQHLHYATDIVAGSCTGLAAVVLVAFALDHLYRNR